MPLAQATKYSDVRAHRSPRPGGQIFVPKLGKEIPFEDWYFRELREGGFLHRYVQGERYQSRQRLRATARQMDGFQQNKKSDFRLLASVPAREFFRWKAVDPHFWDDNKNLKSFKRDNPDACIYL